MILVSAVPMVLVAVRGRASSLRVGEQCRIDRRQLDPEVGEARCGDVEGVGQEVGQGISSTDVMPAVFVRSTGTGSARSR